MVTYQIVHIHPDKSEELIDVVDNPTRIPLITEQPKYLGTWIRDDRKILRWSKGEIHVRVIDYQIKIVGVRPMKLGTMPLYELSIENDEKLKTICLNGHTIVGYDERKVPLWQTNSFGMLSQIVGKEVAYECTQYYEQYLSEFQLPDNLGKNPVLRLEGIFGKAISTTAEEVI